MSYLIKRRINLQLFADGDGGSGGSTQSNETPSPSVNPASDSAPNPDQSGWQEAFKQQGLSFNTPAEAAKALKEATEKAAKASKKNPVDNIAFANLQKEYANLQKEYETLRSSTPQTQKPEGKSNNVDKVMLSKISESLFSNTDDALNQLLEIANGNITAKLEEALNNNPAIKAAQQIKQQQDFTTRLEKFMNSTSQDGQPLYPDIDRYKGVMTQLFSNCPPLQNDEMGMAISYLAAKGISNDTPPAVDVDTLLQDNNVLEKILSNEDIIKKAVTKHMEKVKGNTPPPSTGGSGILPSTKIDVGKGKAAWQNIAKIFKPTQD